MIVPDTFSVKIVIFRRPCPGHNGVRHFFYIIGLNQGKIYMLFAGSWIFYPPRARLLYQIVAENSPDGVFQETVENNIDKKGPFKYLKKSEPGA
jgi:hypothetical protein